jgi:hypothetical protein
MGAFEAKLNRNHMYIQFLSCFATHSSQNILVSISPSSYIYPWYIPGQFISAAKSPSLSNIIAPPSPPCSPSFRHFLTSTFQITPLPKLSSKVRCQLHMTSHHSHACTLTSLQCHAQQHIEGTTPHVLCS